MTLTTDQAHTHQSTGTPLEQRGAVGLIDNLARESALEGQLGGAFANGRENSRWSFSTLGQNHYSPTPFAARWVNSDISLGTHIKEIRRAITKLLEREHRAAQFKLHRDALTWLAKNRSRYSGQWIALRGDELLASGNTARDVYARIRGQEPAPLVVKIESEELPFAGW